MDVIHKICQVDGCETIPNYNDRGEAKGRFCALHKEIGMVNVISDTCKMDGCDIIPAYNVCGEKKGRFCALHKEIGMVNVVSDTCKMDGCSKRPKYNVRGETKGRFCVHHKEPHMVDVRSRSCELDGCETRPFYNVRGETKGRFCALHKMSEMLDVVSKRCQQDGCDTIPSYNYRGETKGRFCTLHKEIGMVNVVSNKCMKDGCEKQPTYNIRGNKKGLFCVHHKEPHMVNVKDRHCEEKSCFTQAWYAPLGQKPSHCAQHKEKGMIRYPTRKCTQCKELGTHEAHGMRYCPDHAPHDADNLGLHPCSLCGLEDILLEGKCETCRPDIVQQHQHAKENRIRDLLTVAGIPFVHDKTLESTQCGRERPDFQIDCGTHFLYVEVDEHQHRSYACECEQTRMVNLVHVRGMPVKWIRYNPDTYEPVRGQRVWTREQREKKLMEYIHYAMKHTPQEDGCMSHVLYLFYDEYDTKKQEWLRLL